MPIESANGTRHLTKRDFAYQTLRDAIMRCELQPGEKLVIDDLARRLNVSIIPIREAIQLLQSEGLVVTVPHAGSTVAPVSRESVQDVFTVLEALETVATRLVAERGDPGELDGLDALVREMDRAVAQKRYAQWASLNTRFHRTIGAAPRLELLREMTERVVARWDRISHFYFKGVLVRRVDGAQAEHRAILAAMRARDLPALERLVRQHNRSALAAYLRYMDDRQSAPSARRRRAT
jgi:DNA-binding GntR family transcriptional regulator